MSISDRSYRTTGLFIVGLSIFLIALDLGAFALCDSGEQVCLSWATNRVSDLALLVFFGLFLSGICVLAVAEEPEPPRPAAAGAPAAAFVAEPRTPQPLPPPPGTYVESRTDGPVPQGGR